MAVGRFDDGIPQNQKFIAAGPEACWLWFCGVMFCRKGLTDGFIPRDSVPNLFTKVRQPYVLAAKLVSVGLWHITEGGYVVNDYHHWNPSKEQVEAYREKERNRKRGLPVMDSAVESGVDSEADSTRSRSRARPPLRSTPEGSGSESSPKAGSRQPAWNPQHRAPQSQLIGRHTWCDPEAIAACARGVCVPERLFTRWRQQFGDDIPEANRTIRAVVERALARYPSGKPIGDDPFRLWTAEWEAQHGTQRPSAASAPTGKGHQTASAFAQAGAALRARKDGQ